MKQELNVNSIKRIILLIVLGIGLLSVGLFYKDIVKVWSGKEIDTPLVKGIWIFKGISLMDDYYAYQFFESGRYKQVFKKDYLNNKMIDKERVNQGREEGVYVLDGSILKMRPDSETGFEEFELGQYNNGNYYFKRETLLLDVLYVQSFDYSIFELK